jgi:DNA-binding CsgD family transcriptional regulator
MDLAGIVVCGAAGVGKSRIARDALSSAASTGCETRWAVATSSARPLPLGAFAPWVGSTVADTLQLVRGLIDSLTSAAPGITVVVGVDDVHLLDELSTFVLHQIIQRRAAKVVLTIRDGEPVPAGLQDVWTAGQLDRLDLQPLSREETAALLSGTLGGSLDPDAVRRLWMLTGGNVLYLRNIVEQEVADGRLVQQHGYWSWSGDPIVPPSLVELIESRMGALPDPVSEVVDALAVGEPITLASLIRITDPAAVEEADVRGLITLSHDDRAEVRLAHPLYGEVRRKRAASTRLRRLRSLVATELAATDDGEDTRVVVRRAALSLDSDLEPDPDLLVRAAQGAMWLGDTLLADRLADAAVRAGAGTDAYLIRSFALAWQGRGEEADAILADIPTSSLTNDDLVLVAGFRIGGALWGLADPERAKMLIDEASCIATARSRGWIDAYLTLYLASMAQPQAAMKAGADLAFDALPAVMGSAAAWSLVVAHGDAGRTTDALTSADTGYRYLTRTLGAPHMRFLIVDKHVGALLQSGRVDEACSVAEHACHEAADLPGVAQLLAAAIAGRAALGAGRLRDACSVLEPVVELFTGDANGFRYRYLIPFTTALAMRGLTDDATRALIALDESHHRSWRFVDYERGLAQAWVAAAQGAVSEAISLSLSEGETARANGQFAPEVICLQTATQFGDSSTAARLWELEAIVEGPRAGLAARFAAALKSSDAAELAAVSEGFESIGDLVAAVDAAAHASIVYRRQDLRGSALRCSTRADALAERCEGANTPALRQASQRLPLTSREREIVMLLGEGLSSREVAARLTLSVRTVEGHIYRAMAKTGTLSRTELATLLGPSRGSEPRPTTR